MMNIFFHIMRFLTEFVWFIWPAALLGDVVLSNYAVRNSTIHMSRWILRIIHSLTMAYMVMVFGVEFFWLNVVKIHYHGGKEILVIGPLVLYVSIRLSQRLDASMSRTGKSGINSAVAMSIPAISAALLFLACASSITRSIPFLTDREPIIIFLVSLFTLIAASSLSNCRVRRMHVVITSSLAITSFLLAVVFFIAADFKFLGFLPWGYANDDPWLYVLTGLVCFTILSINSILRRKKEPNQDIQ